MLVHDDYGPNNMLFDPVTFATAAVLDWELAHTDDPVADLAWCEWIIRMHHPGAVDQLEQPAEYAHMPTRVRLLGRAGCLAGRGGYHGWDTVAAVSRYR